MFQGVNNINMDAKGRMAMPTRLREPLQAHCQGQLVVTVDNYAPCLVIFPLPEWKIAAAEIQAMPSIKPEIRRFKRLVLGFASDLQLDGNGRILLPQPLREHAKLEKKLKLVGLGHKLELWSEELLQSEYEQAVEDAHSGDAIPEEMNGLTAY